MGMRVFTRPSFVCVCEFYLGRESFHFLNVSRPVRLRLYIGESSLRPIGLLASTPAAARNRDRYKNNNNNR